MITYYAILLIQVTHQVLSSLFADKPPVEELFPFLDFQHPKQWAPVFGDIPLGPDRKHHGAASLQFSLMGPKLYVNTDEVNPTR